MKHHLFKLVIPFLTCATLLLGCATEPMISRSVHTTTYPVVTINGKPIGNPKNPYENRFLPGAIFVLDTPSDITQVSWVWAYDKTDRVLSLSAQESRIWYLRWHIPPLNFPGERYLEIAPKETAIREIEPLRFTGYVKLTTP